MAREMKPEVLGEVKIACPNFPDIAFSVPVFRYWEIKPPVEEKGACVIRLQGPDDVDYESPRLIKITRAPKGAPQAPVYTTPRGISYTRTIDLSLYQKGYEPVPGEWTHLHFWGPKDTVEIYVAAGSEKHGWSGELFIKKLEETFRFK